jgi:hypothetical protein
VFVRLLRRSASLQTSPGRRERIEDVFPLVTSQLSAFGITTTFRNFQSCNNRPWRERKCGIGDFILGVGQVVNKERLQSASSCKGERGNYTYVEWNRGFEPAAIQRAMWTVWQRITDSPHLIEFCPHEDTLGSTRTTWIQCTHLYPLTLSSSLILYSHLYLGLSSGLFPSSFVLELYMHLASTSCVIQVPLI